MDLPLILTKIGLTQVQAQDVSLLLVVVAISFIFGIFIGRYRLISILINIYVAFSIVSVIPEDLFESYFYKLILFLVVVVLLTLSSRRLFEIYITGSGSGFLWRVFVMSFLEVVFLLSVSLSIIPKKAALEYISNQSYRYIASDYALLFWMTAPLLFMFFIHKRLNR